MQFALLLDEYLYSTPQQLAKKLRYFCKNPRHVRTHKVMVRIREQVNCALQFMKYAVLLIIEHDRGTAFAFATNTAVKRGAKTYNLFCNIAVKRIEK